MRKINPYKTSLSAVKKIHFAKRGIEIAKLTNPAAINNLASFLRRSSTRTIIKTMSCGFKNIYSFLLEYFSRIFEVVSFLLEICKIKSAIKPVNAI